MRVRSHISYAYVAVLLLALALAACGGGGGGGGNGASTSGDGGAAPGSGGSQTPPVLVSRFAYVANFDDGTVSAYTVDAATGRLRHNGYVLAGTNPHSIAVHPSGRFVYVTNSGSGNLSAYAVGADGRLAAIAVPPECSGCTPRGLAVDPSGSFLYVALEGAGIVQAYAIGPTGTLAFVREEFSVATPFAIAVDHAGKFVYVTSSSRNTISAFAVGPDGGLAAIDTDAATAGTQRSIATGTGPRAVALDPAGKFLYVANQGSGSVSAYTVDAASGALAPVAGSPFAAGTDPHALAVDPSGRFVYVANHGSDSVSVYAIDTASGALARLDADGDPGNGAQDFAAGDGPAGVTVDATGSFLYVPNRNSDTTSAYRIDAITGRLTRLPDIAGRAGNSAMATTRGTAAVRHVPRFAYVTSDNRFVMAYAIDRESGQLIQAGMEAMTEARPSAIAADPAGRFVYVANTDANSVLGFGIDAASGELIGAITRVATGASPSSIAVDPAGRFAYVVNATTPGTVSAYRIDAATGALTPIDADPSTQGVQDFPTGNFPQSVAIAPSGRFAYVVSGSPGSLSAYTIDAATGALAPVGTPVATGGSAARAVAIDPTGRFAYVTNGLSHDVSAFRIDPRSGALSAAGAPVATGGKGPHAIATDPSGRFVYVTHPLTWLDSGGNVISAATHDVAALRIDPETGGLTLVGSPVATGRLPYSIAVDGSGRFAYVAGNESGSVSWHALDAASGEPAGAVGTASVPFPLAVTTTATPE